MLVLKIKTNMTMIQIGEGRDRFPPQQCNPFNCLEMCYIEGNDLSTQSISRLFCIVDAKNTTQYWIYSRWLHMKMTSEKTCHEGNRSYTKPTKPLYLEPPGVCAEITLSLSVRLPAVRTPHHREGGQSERTFVWCLCLSSDNLTANVLSKIISLF